jgi:hypothetical protein
MIQSNVLFVQSAAFFVAIPAPDVIRNSTPLPGTHFGVA